MPIRWLDRILPAPIDGAPTCLLCATGNGPGGFRHAMRAWNRVIQLIEKTGKSHTILELVLHRDRHSEAHTPVGREESFAST
jgi:hypothetical protein